MIVDEIDSGKRLDAVLAKHPDCANLGTRARKRLCEEGMVLVNGIARNAVYKVRPRQEISIENYEENVENSENNFQLKVIKEDDNYIAFYKPAGIATEKLHGSSSHSLEQEILKKFPNVQLLNRLDNETSGIVMGAKTDEAKENWKIAQDAGKIAKKYYTLVENTFSEQENFEIRINNLIDLSKTKVKALEKEEYDKARHTLVSTINENKKTELRNKFLPQDLASISDSYANLINGRIGDIVECTIYKGVRHQIRCHLASIDLPLVGDVVYGSGLMEECFFLHHYKLESDLFSVEYK